MALRITLCVLYTVLVWFIAVFFTGLGWNATVPVELALLAAMSCGLEFFRSGFIAAIIGLFGVFAVLSALGELLAVCLKPIMVDMRIHYGVLDTVSAAQASGVLAIFMAVTVLGLLPFGLEWLAKRIERSRESGSEQ